MGTYIFAQHNYYILSKDRGMSGKHNFKTSKDYPYVKRSPENSFSEQTRVIQKNLVFVSYLPFSLHDLQLLKQDIYFGRYGNVKKLVIKKPSGQKKANTFNAYITYETDFQASLAIVALDNLKIEQRPLKVSYGTTKYCSNFIKGYECRNPDCYFLHRRHQEGEIRNGQFQNALQNHTEEAFEAVSGNLEFLVRQMMFSDEKEEGFPTYQEIIEFLINESYITRSQVRKWKKKYRRPRMTGGKSSSRQTLNERNGCPEQEKAKSNSFSTMGSPSKLMFDEDVNGEVEQVEKEKIEGLEQKKQSEQKSQTGNAEQKKPDLEQMIEKMIINRLFQPHKQHQRSKLYCIKEDPAENSDSLLKMRNIVLQQFLFQN